MSHRGEKKDSNMERLGGTVVAFPINRGGGLSKEAACELRLEEVRAPVNRVSEGRRGTTGAKPHARSGLDTSCHSWSPR